MLLCYYEFNFILIRSNVKHKTSRKEEDLTGQLSLSGHKKIFESHFSSFKIICMESDWLSFIHSFVRSFMHSFVRSFIRLIVHSFVHSSFHSYIHSIHSLILSFILSSNSFIHSLTHTDELLDRLIICWMNDEWTVCGLTDEAINE